MSIEWLVGADVIVIPGHSKVSLPLRNHHFRLIRRAIDTGSTSELWLFRRARDSSGKPAAQSRWLSVAEAGRWPRGHFGFGFAQCRLAALK